MLHRHTAARARERKRARDRDETVLLLCDAHAVTEMNANKIASN